MLHFFRNLAEHPISKFLLMILALSFAAWGIGDYISGRGDSSAIHVNGTAISVYDVNQATSNKSKTLANNLAAKLCLMKH